MAKSQRPILATPALAPATRSEAPSPVAQAPSLAQATSLAQALSLAQAPSLAQVPSLAQAASLAPATLPLAARSLAQALSAGAQPATPTLASAKGAQTLAKSRRPILATPSLALAMLSLALVPSLAQAPSLALAALSLAQAPKPEKKTKARQSQQPKHSPRDSEGFNTSLVPGGHTSTLALSGKWAPGL